MVFRSKNGTFLSLLTVMSLVACGGDRPELPPVNLVRVTGIDIVNLEHVLGLDLRVDVSVSHWPTGGPTPDPDVSVHLDFFIDDGDPDLTRAVDLTAFQVLAVSDSVYYSALDQPTANELGVDGYNAYDRIVVTATASLDGSSHEVTRSYYYYSAPRLSSDFDPLPPTTDILFIETSELDRELDSQSPAAFWTSMPMLESCACTDARPLRARLSRARRPGVDTRVDIAFLSQGVDTNYDGTRTSVCGWLAGDDDVPIDGAVIPGGETASSPFFIAGPPLAGTGAGGGCPRPQFGTWDQAGTCTGGFTQSTCLEDVDPDCDGDGRFGISLKAEAQVNDIPNVKAGEVIILVGGTACHN